MSESEKRVCRTPGCENPVYARDICKTCYSDAGQKVRRGRSTWARLEELGIVGSSSMKRVGKSPFTLALEEAEKLHPAQEVPAPHDERDICRVVDQ